MQNSNVCPQRNAPVLIVFFIRPHTLSQVFESVRRAKPAKLFLVQDGPREGYPDDLEKMEACRRVVENIDWDCEVYQNYAEQNQSAHTRIMSGITWAFQYTDRLIYLEDDIVPKPSFYRFCSALLEIYKDDERIFDVTGGQKLGVYKGYPYDCIFTSMAMGNGFALWKRSWDNVAQFNVTEWEKDKDFMQWIYPCMSDDPIIKFSRKKIASEAKKFRAALLGKGQITTWHFPVGMTSRCQSQLSIMAAKNMVSYIGVTDDAMFSGSDIRALPAKIRRVFFAEAYDDLEFPLKLPPFMIRNTHFEKIYIKATKPIPILSVAIYEIRRCLHGDSKGVWRGFQRYLESKRNRDL